MQEKNKFDFMLSEEEEEKQSKRLLLEMNQSNTEVMINRKNKFF